MNTSNLILCGLPGTGKTSVGRIVSEKLDCQFIDTDELIEEICGMSITSIFNIHGERYFREKESEVIKELKGVENKVIATGAGMITYKNNRKLLSEIGTMILLTASINTICCRINGCNKRPLMQGNIKNQIRLLAERRHKYYDGLKNKINTDAKSVENICDELIRKYGKCYE